MNSNNSNNRNNRNSNNRIGNQAFGKSAAPARGEVSKATPKATAKNSSNGGNKSNKAKQRPGKGDDSKTFPLGGAGLPTADRPWIDRNRIESEFAGVIEWISQVEDFIMAGISQLAELATRIDQASEMAAKFTIGTRDEQDAEAEAAEAAKIAETANAKPRRGKTNQERILPHPSDIGDGEQGSFGSQDFFDQNRNGVAEHEYRNSGPGSDYPLQIGVGQRE